MGQAAAVQCIGNGGGGGDSSGICKGKSSGEGSDVGRCGDVDCGGSNGSNSSSDDGNGNYNVLSIVAGGGGDSGAIASTQGGRQWQSPEPPPPPLPASRASLARDAMARLLLSSPPLSLVGVSKLTLTSLNFLVLVLPHYFQLVSQSNSS